MSHHTNQQLKKSIQSLNSSRKPKSIKRIRIIDAENTDEQKSYQTKPKQNYFYQYLNYGDEQHHNIGDEQHINYGNEQHQNHCDEQRQNHDEEQCLNYGNDQHENYGNKHDQKYGDEYHLKYVDQQNCVNNRVQTKKQFSRQKYSGHQFSFKKQLTSNVYKISDDPQEKQTQQKLKSQLAELKKLQRMIVMMRKKLEVQDKQFMEVNEKHQQFESQIQKNQSLRTEILELKDLMKELIVEKDTQMMTLLAHQN